jgi:hypothetical protein
LSCSGTACRTACRRQFCPMPPCVVCCAEANTLLPTIAEVFALFTRTAVLNNASGIARLSVASALHPCMHDLPSRLYTRPKCTNRHPAHSQRASAAQPAGTCAYQKHTNWVDDALEGSGKARLLHVDRGPRTWRRSVVQFQRGEVRIGYRPRAAHPLVPGRNAMIFQCRSLNCVLTYTPCTKHLLCRRVRVLWRCHHVAAPLTSRSRPFSRPSCRKVCAS